MVLLNTNMIGLRDWNDVFQSLTVSNFQPKLAYITKLSLKMEGEIRHFIEKDSSTDVWLLN